MTEKNDIPAPILETYLDYREFLRDYYNHKKSVSKFSYQKWADELNISSKGYLRLIVSGKRPLSEDLIENFTNYFDFNKRQKSFFHNLVKYNQAKNLETRTLFFSKLQSAGQLERKWINNTYDYLSDEWLPRIHTLLAQDGLDRSIDSIAKGLNLKPQKVLSLLKKLKKLGFANHKDGSWYSKDIISSVPDQVNDIAIQNFHKRSLKKAINSIEIDPKERHLHATYFVIPEDELAQIREKINLFSRELLSQYGNLKIKPDTNSRLYQININAIPMSDQLIHSNNECAKGSSTLLENLEVTT